MARRPAHSRRRRPKGQVRRRLDDASKVAGILGFLLALAQAIAALGQALGWW